MLVLTISKNDNHNLVGAFPDLNAIKEHIENSWQWTEELEFDKPTEDYRLDGLKPLYQSSLTVPHNGWAFYVVWSSCTI